MDVIVTFEDEPTRGPCVSLLELRDLFEDHPTADLVVAMCEQACTRLGRPVANCQELIRSMYQVPTAREPRQWLEEQLTYEHELCLDTGVKRWLEKGRA